jgi:hypothetical protein
MWAAGLDSTRVELCRLTPRAGERRQSGAYGTGSWADTPPQVGFCRATFRWRVKDCLVGSYFILDRWTERHRNMSNR